MTWISGAFLIVLITVPLLSWWSARKHGADVVEQLCGHRIQFYALSALTQWALTGLSLLVIWHDGQTVADIGFHPWRSWIATVSLGLRLMVALGMIMAAILWMQRKRRWSETHILMAILPETKVEKGAFVALAATAGFCEEMLYRGFVITRLIQATDHPPSAVILAVIIFSLGHGYQGLIGLLRAGTLGAVLAATFVLTGSMVPGMISHFLFDALAGFWGRKLLGSDEFQTMACGK